MSALIQSFSSLSLSSRSLRGDARVASPSAMPMRKRTAVVTEAVCCFSPLFLGKNWSKFSSLSLFTRNEALLLSYSLANEMRTILRAKENATEMCMLLFKRERANGARVRRQPSKSFRRRKCFLFLSFPPILSEGLLQVLEKQNPPLLCFSKRNSR